MLVDEIVVVVRISVVHKVVVDMFVAVAGSRCCMLAGKRFVAAFRKSTVAGKDGVVACCVGRPYIADRPPRKKVRNKSSCRVVIENLKR